MKSKGWALVLCLWSVQGCSRVWVPIGDVQARVESREVKRQLRLLASKDKDVWQAAYWRLVDRGPSVAHILIQALDAREPLAGRAMLILGELAEPATLAHLKSLEQDPRLGPAASRALQISEEALWRRVEESQDRGSCEGYLTWFPGGQHRWAAQFRLNDLDAEIAFEGLGKTPGEDAIASFLQNFGDTEIGSDLKKRLAVEAVAKAQVELDAGRFRAAMHELNKAQNWDSGLDVGPVEASVRAGLGRILVSEGSRQLAIVEFAKARSLGAPVEMDLGRLLVERARERQASRDFKGGLEDLDVALSVYPKLAGVIKRVRRDIERQLLLEIKSGALYGDSVAGALLRSGPNGRKLLSERLEGGRNRALVQRLIADATLGTDTAEMRAYRLKAVDDVVAISRSNAAAFLGSEARLARLLDGERLWDPRQGPTRDAARKVVSDHIRGLRWRAELAERLPGADNSPSDSLHLNQEIEALLLANKGPDDLSLGLTVRVQLLEQLLRLHSALQARVRQQPLLFAAGLVGLNEVPTSLTAWGAFMLNEPNPHELVLRNGGGARMEAQRLDGKLHLRLVADSDTPLDTEVAVAEALTVLFGAARSLVHHHSELEGVTVEVGQGERFKLRARVALSRESIRRFNWRIIQNEAPFGLAHLVFVFDHEIH
jgi:tetratricopeptide (TPR) repeat protein